MRFQYWTLHVPSRPCQRSGFGCGTQNPALPGKRLIWGAIGGEYYVVHCERGAIAHTFHILVAKVIKGEANAKIVWQAVRGPFKDYAAFVDGFRNGKLDDRLDYPH